jgi:hypothetical protein
MWNHSSTSTVMTRALAAGIDAVVYLIRTGGSSAGFIDEFRNGIDKLQDALGGLFVTHRDTEGALDLQDQLERVD